jgi:steroid 5-alpha reductase family enzyme
MALLLLLTLFCCSLLMLVAWRVQQASGNSTWVDVAWTFGTGAIGILLTLWPLPGHGPVTTRQVLVSIAAAAWALRLGSHLLRRALKGRDDPRYADLKTSWGAAYVWKMPVFLQLQGLSVYVLGLFIMLAGRNPAPGPGVLDVIAILVALAAIIGEAVADREVARFAAEPANRGTICEIGLWGWSRHPNYFCEWLIWVVYALFAISGFAWFWGVLAWAGPIVMYAVLVHGSGIPPTEAHMLRSRGDAFRDYQRRVSAFFPLPPKRNRT